MRGVNVKVGRNDLCPCGNGKKYKKCCMRKDEALENRTTRQADPVEIKQVDQIQQPLLTKPDLQQQPLKMNPESVIDKEDLSLMEEIGIPLEEAHQFYVKDILQCFKEKGAEKSQSTYYKYRLGLQTIGFFLSRRILNSWSDVNQKDWEKWLSYSYLVFNMDATVSQVKGFMAVLNSFIVQIDETYGTEHLPIVQKLVKELEPSVIASVKTIEAYSSYQERRNKPEYGLDYLWDMLHCAPIQTGDSVQGIFEIKESDEKTVNSTIAWNRGSNVYDRDFWRALRKYRKRIHSFWLIYKMGLDGSSQRSFEYFLHQAAQSISSYLCKPG